MRSSTPTQFQSSRMPISSSNSHSNSPTFGNLMPEPRAAPFQQRPSYQAPRPAQYETSQYPKLAHEYGRPPVTSSYEYGRPPVTGSYPAPAPAFGNDSTVITTTRHKSSWIEEARESTLNFKKNGSPVPLVWILVEDKSIPPNAVPFGEDRNGQALFIARVHLEGGLHLGKVGYHTSGALVSYVGKEHLIEKYEVLVCASQLRWGLASQDATGSLVPGTVVLARQQQGRQELKRTASSVWSRETRETRESRESTSVLQTTFHVDEIPRFNPSFLIQEEELRRVAEYKTVILIDDSISMAEGDSWNQVREALGGIVDIAIQYGSKGLDLHFMHQTQFAENMRSRFDVEKLFDQLSPTGEDTPTGVRLEQLIEMYLPLIEHPSSTHEPISVIVITDGAATDSDELLRCIVEAASRLDRQQVPLEKFGIQFVQIGTDQDAARALHVLDDELSDRYKIRDIVDTTPFDPSNGAFNTDYMIKILIGSLHQEADNRAAEMPLPERKPPTLAMPGYDRHPSPIPRSASPQVPAGGLRPRGY
ncbi:uncharacterized protein BJ212DRAFT_1480799 [Suillus subaureus]|uniref:VWFA domain-containing protein n=1 Tax=Suillus subaureus TaxID=48587 RepID=A0A9P7EAP9_9AGAM|nr:uncharacterized protein BJ212DRAFT_1480799 [Suillus subaureus]KAG1816351.1 hypothetical protein BJ212DRAFT_1480799 [Suillus subaureus]